jgi:phosphatidylglycerophosphatase A
LLDAKKNKHRAPIFPLNARTLALTSLGLGFLRPAPGTWGSMPPVAMAVVLPSFVMPLTMIDLALGVVLVVSSVLCIAFGGYAEERFGRTDAGEVVIDETAGQSLALLFAPIGCFPIAHADASINLLVNLVLPCVAAFLLFRLFDIVKPWPARRLESLPAGWGVLADDLLAGLYAAAVMWLGLWLIL